MLGIFTNSIAPIAPVRKAPLKAILTLCGLAVVVFAFVNAGRWLVREDPLQKAAAIAVLSGKMPGRALEAVKIYKQGCAPEVWLTHSTEPGATLQKLSVPYTGEEIYDKQILLREGVPESAIRILDPPIVNTADEMLTIGAALAKTNDRRVILVTSRVHTRRTKVLWDDLSGKNGVAIVRAVSDDPFDAEHWWSNTSDALDVVRELLGLLNAWAGLPLHPAGT